MRSVRQDGAHLVKKCDMLALDDIYCARQLIFQSNRGTHTRSNADSIEVSYYVATLLGEVEVYMFKRLLKDLTDLGVASTTARQQIRYARGYGYFSSYPVPCLQEKKNESAVLMPLLLSVPQNESLQEKMDFKNDWRLERSSAETQV